MKAARNDSGCRIVLRRREQCDSRVLPSLSHGVFRVRLSDEETALGARGINLLREDDHVILAHRVCPILTLEDK